MSAPEPADSGGGRRPLSVLLAGGGTAGHVAPLIALADCLRMLVPDVRITALGTAEGLEARLVPAAGYELALVPRVPMPRKPSTDLGRLPIRLRAAHLAAAQAITDSGADVVVGFGGYVSAPAYIAARRLGVPIVVHEANSRPGLANRLGARFTSFVGCAFPARRFAHSIIAAPAAIIGTDSHCPIVSPSARKPRNASGSRAHSARKRIAP